MQHFAPMEAIPSAFYLTSYMGGMKHFMGTPLQRLAQEIPRGIAQSPDWQGFPVGRNCGNASL